MPCLSQLCPVPTSLGAAPSVLPTQRISGSPPNFVVPVASAGIDPASLAPVPRNTFSPLLGPSLFCPLFLLYLTPPTSLVNNALCDFHAATSDSICKGLYPKLRPYERIFCVQSGYSDATETKTVVIKSMRSIIALPSSIVSFCSVHSQYNELEGSFYTQTEKSHNALGTSSWIRS